MRNRAKWDVINTEIPHLVEKNSIMFGTRLAKVWSSEGGIESLEGQLKERNYYEQGQAQQLSRMIAAKFKREFIGWSAVKLRKGPSCLGEIFECGHED